MGKRRPAWTCSIFAHGEARVGNLDERGDLQVGSRPRLLYLAYFFKPVNVVASVRTWNTAKQLARHGWDVTVMTPDPVLFWAAQPSDGVDEQLHEMGVRRVVTGHDARWMAGQFIKQPTGTVYRAVAKVGRIAASLVHVMPESGWIRPCLEADRAVPAGSYDLVLGTGNPFDAFALARLLARRHGCPYVLDYRDLWTGCPIWRTPTWQTRLERALLRGASAVVSVSSPQASALSTAFHCACPVHVIRNGYDAEELSTVQPHRFGAPAVVYTGTMRPPIIVPDPLMAALAVLDRSGAPRTCDWKFHYYGHHSAHVLEAARRTGVAHRVAVHGLVSREEALSAVRGATVAVVITHVGETVSDADLGIVTGKIFEAIGLGTPVLLITPPGSDAEAVLRESGAGRAFKGSDTAGMAEFLAEILRTGRQEYEPPHSLSWDVLGDRLDAALRACLAPTCADAFGATTRT